MLLQPSRTAFDRSHCIGSSITAYKLRARTECRASAKLTNLQVEALQGPCIMHRRGTLLVQGCALHSGAQGMSPGQLYSALESDCGSVFRLTIGIGSAWLLLLPCRVTTPVACS